MRGVVRRFEGGPEAAAAAFGLRWRGGKPPAPARTAADMTDSGCGRIAPRMGAP